ncbi:MAG: ribonuclease H-like domain-containing protein [Planctomycetota bacterium]
MRGTDDWRTRLSRWLNRQGKDGAEPTSRRPGGPFPRSDQPVGLEQYFRSARGLRAERCSERGAGAWRLSWLADQLPVPEGLAGSLRRSIARFGPEIALRQAHPDFGPLGSVGPEELLFFDTETLGLGNAGVFLVGCLRLVGGELELRQHLAEDYSAEPSVLRAFAAAAERTACLVSFNGKAFDLPLLRCRAGVWRIELPADPAHLDLLYEARRRWADRLPNCRLQTLEEELSGRRRVGDVPGRRIPSVYHDFVESGDARRLAPILEHNMLDLLAMARLLEEFLG